MPLCLCGFFVGFQESAAIYFFEMTSDLDLLRRFARENSQDAFAEIVRRHLNLVYSAALRQVRSPQLAEEVAQSVFADLARVAATPSSPQALTPSRAGRQLTPSARNLAANCANKSPWR